MALCYSTAVLHLKGPYDYNTDMLKIGERLRLMHGMNELAWWRDL